MTRSSLFPFPFPFPFLLWTTAALPACSGTDRAEFHGWTEGRELDVAPLVGGRLERIAVDEGDRVRAGDTVAVLIRAETPTELDAARARADAAEARLRELQRGSRTEEIAAAAAELESAGVVLTAARREAERVQELAERDLASDQALEAAAAAASRALARRDVARETLERLRRGPRAEQLEAARGEAEAARAAYRSALASAGELTLVAPASAPVLLRNYDTGELVPAGHPVVTLLSDERWVRVWVPQERPAGVRVGELALVRVDAVPDTSFAARVVAVSPRAEFTPRVALTEEERADLMYAVRLRLEDGVLPVGLPARVEFADGDR